MKKLIIACLTFATFTLSAIPAFARTIIDNDVKYTAVGGFKKMFGKSQITYYCDKVRIEPYYGAECLDGANMIVRLEKKKTPDTDYQELVRGNERSLTSANPDLKKYESPTLLHFYVTESVLDNGSLGSSFFSAGVVLAVTGSIDLVTMPFQLPFVLGKKEREKRDVRKMKDISYEHYYHVRNRSFKFIAKKLKAMNSVLE